MCHFVMFRGNVWLQIISFRSKCGGKGVCLVCKQFRYLVCERQ